MTKKERKLVAALLETASNKFSNHGCNDLDAKWFDGWTEEEKELLAKECREWNGDPNDGQSLEQMGDWFLMSFFAAKIEKGEL